MMQRQLQEVAALKAELAHIAAREKQASASLREAAAQMSAAQEIAQVAREKQAESDVAMRKHQELTEGMAALREEVERLYQSRQVEIEEAEAARLDAEADVAVEKATVASERARADALREAARKMEEGVRAVHEEASARVSAAEKRARRAEEQLVRLQSDGEATVRETKRLVGLIEEEAAAKIRALESSASAAASHAAEAESEVATLNARLRAGELHLSAAASKWESERDQAVAATLAAAEKAHAAALESVKSSLQAEHADIQKVALARINSLCHDLKSQGDELAGLREENAQMRTKLLGIEQDEHWQTAARRSRVLEGSPANISSPTARVGPAVALIAATRRTDGLEREAMSLRQEVLRLQKKVAGYRAREEKAIQAAKISGLRGGSPDRAIRAAQREQQRELREAGRRKRPLNRENPESGHATASSDGEESARLSVRFDDTRVKTANKARRKTSPRRASKERRDYEEDSRRSARATHIRTIGTQTVDEVVLVADMEPLLVELPEALEQEIARRKRAEELLHALYQAQQDVVRHSPQAATAPAKTAVTDGTGNIRRHAIMALQQESSGPGEIVLHVDVHERDEEEEEDDDEEEMLKRWNSWNNEPAMPPTPTRGDNRNLTIISTGSYSSEEDADETQSSGAVMASAARVAVPLTDVREQTVVRTDASASAAQGLPVDAAVAATTPHSQAFSSYHAIPSNQSLGLDDSVQDIILEKDNVDKSVRISPSGGVSPPALTIAELNYLATRSVVSDPVDTPRPGTSRGRGGRGGRGRGGRGGGGRGRESTSGLGGRGANASRGESEAGTVSQPSVTPATTEDAPAQEKKPTGLSAEAPAFEMQTDRELLEELDREEQPEEIEPAEAVDDGASHTLQSEGETLKQKEASLAEEATVVEDREETEGCPERHLLVICPEGVRSGDPVSRVHPDRKCQALTHVCRRNTPSLCPQLTICLEDGTEFVIEVPEGVAPGDEIEIRAPMGAGGATS